MQSDSKKNAFKMVICKIKKEIHLQEIGCEEGNWIRFCTILTDSLVVLKCLILWKVFTAMGTNTI